MIGLESLRTLKRLSKKMDYHPNMQTMNTLMDSLFEAYDRLEGLTVWAVQQPYGSCEDQEAHSHEEGLVTVKLFTTKQAADRWVARRVGSWSGGTFRVAELTVFDAVDKAGV